MHPQSPTLPLTISLAVLFVAASAAYADNRPSVAAVVPTLRSADLVEAISRARSSGEEPLAAVIRALSAYPNAQTNAEEVRGALTQLGISVSGQGASTLSHLDRIVKTGNQLTISNHEESRIEGESGSITFAKTVKARITSDRSGVTLDDVEGVSVSAFLSGKIRRLEFYKNAAGDPMLRATAKVWGFSTSREINLRELKEKMDAERGGSPATTDATGATDRLNHVAR